MGETPSRRKSRWSLAIPLSCIVCGLLLLVLNLHVIRHKGGWTWGWKAEMSLRRTLVDTTKWEMEDYYENLDILGILMRDGRKDFIPGGPSPMEGAIPMERGLDGKPIWPSHVPTPRAKTPEEIQEIKERMIGKPDSSAVEPEETEPSEKKASTEKRLRERIEPVE